MDYEKATLDELQAEFIRLAEIVVATNNERCEILCIMNRRKSEAAAKQKVSDLSQEERDALRAALDEEAAK